MASLDFVKWCWAFGKAGMKEATWNLEDGSVQLFGPAIGSYPWWQDAERLLSLLTALAQKEPHDV